MSIARLGGDGSSIIPMKSLSAFMYAPLRMLPASLIADCSSGPRPFDDPGGRRSISSASRMATRWGKTSSVRPVRSPSMCISTAATGSSGSAIRWTASSSGATLSIGTLIMIVSPVIVDSAVAAWPAPMLAISRSASSSRAVNDRMSSIAAPLDETAYIDDQRRCSVAENRRAAEQRQPVPHAVELLHDDFLLAGQLVHDEARAPVGDLQHDDLPAVIAHRRHPEQTPETDQRQDVVAQDQHFASLDRAHQRRLELDRLVHMGHRQRVDLIADLRQQRADDRQRQRKPNGDCRADAGGRLDVHRA